MTETTQTGLSDNAAGAVSYLTFIPAVIFLILAPYNTNSYVRFHSWQSILLNVAAFVVWIVLGFLAVFMATVVPFGYFGGVGIWTLVVLAVRLFLFVVWLICVIKAANGERFKLPIIGPLAEQLANK
jgi:uncharacterized membrane protein